MYRVTRAAESGLTEQGRNDNQQTVRQGKEKPFKELIDSIANSILKVDPSVISCHIFSDTGDAVIADVVKPEFKNLSPQFSQSGKGMAPHWTMLALRSFRRLDDERSKLNYITVVRNNYLALLFPVKLRGSEVAIGVETAIGTDPQVIYAAIMDLVRREEQHH